MEGISLYAPLERKNNVISSSGLKMGQASKLFQDANIFFSIRISGVQSLQTIDHVSSRFVEVKCAIITIFFNKIFHLYLQA